MTTQSASESPAGSLRFLVTVGCWFVGLFGLMRLTWVETNVLTPLAQIQQRVADQLTGLSPANVYADASCSGADPMALCFGTIIAFPAAWGERARGIACGLLAITVLNVMRIGSLSLVASDEALFQPLHVYVWPAILIVASVAYVYWWMDRQAPGAVRREESDRGLDWISRRFLLRAVVLVVAYFAAAPIFYGSAAIETVGRWVAATGGGLLAATGVPLVVNGTLLQTPHAAFIVTQECVVTPLIPVYLAAIWSAPLSGRVRALSLAAAPLLFFALGVARVLVIGLPVTLVGSTNAAIHGFSQMVAGLVLVALAAVWAGAGLGRGRVAARAALGIAAGVGVGLAAALLWGDLVTGAAGRLQALAGHAGHGYADGQGALAMLPAFQLGLYAALLAATRGLGRGASAACHISPRRAWAAFGALAAAQVALLIPLGELSTHFGLDPHVALLRAWAILAPVALVWLLLRPAAASAPAQAAQHPVPA